MQDHHSNQNVMQMQNVSIEELPSEHHLRDAKQFSSPLFLLYKFWLILNFAFAFLGEYALLSVFQNMEAQSRLSQMTYVMALISLLLLFFACGEMLFAITRRKSRAAQRGLLKFQYLLIGLTLFLTLQRKPQNFIQLLMILFVLFVPIANLVGGFAVLRAFNKNNPFGKSRNSEVSEISNRLRTDFLEQNEAIASEVAGYEQQLSKWPYVVYNWWLKLAVVFEIFVIFASNFSRIMVGSVDLVLSLNGSLLIGASVLSLFNAYSRFEMENAIQTRNLTRSKRAVFLLKISIVSSTLSYFSLVIKGDGTEVDNIPIGTFMWLASFVIIPVLCLLGAIKVQKLIEKRDSLAKF